MARSVGGGTDDAVWAEGVARSASPERARIGAFANGAAAVLANQFSECRVAIGRQLTVVERNSFRRLHRCRALHGHA